MYQLKSVVGDRLAQHLIQDRPYGNIVEFAQILDAPIDLDGSTERFSHGFALLAVAHDLPGHARYPFG